VYKTPFDFLYFNMDESWDDMYYRNFNKLDWPIPYGHFQLRWFCICILQGGSLLLDRFWVCLTEPCKVPYEKFSKNNLY
jgi:hypothetical protein